MIPYHVFTHAVMLAQARHFEKVTQVLELHVVLVWKSHQTVDLKRIHLLAKLDRDGYMEERKDDFSNRHRDSRALKAYGWYFGF